MSWISAEHALQHARNNISSVSEVFGRWQIQKSEYVVLAGFDESLIKSGVGYLEQIHVFIITEVDSTSSLLSELGRLFSPFSSILFTESSSYHLPVFKDDGSIWEFDELVYFTASKFANGGSGTPLTTISLSPSQIPSQADGMTGFSQSSSGSGEGEKDRKLDKGKKRDTGDKDEADKDNKYPSNNSEGLPGDQGGIITEPTEISINVDSEIYLVKDEQSEQNPFQILTMHSSLTIEVCCYLLFLHSSTSLIKFHLQTIPLALNPPPGRFSERFVQFTGLAFDIKLQTENTYYKLFHLEVVVDSQQRNARAHSKDIKPKTTPSSNGEGRQSSSMKSGWTCGITAGVIAALNPQATITGTATRTNEETVSSEKVQYYDAITSRFSKGKVQWDFDIDDVHYQKKGFHMPENVLPTVRFKFFGKSKEPAPPPKDMDIAITSFWSIISPSETTSSWIHKFLHPFKSTGINQTTSYSNLLQIVALKADLSNLSMPEPTSYMATVEFRPGASDPHKVVVERRAADSVYVVPAVVST